MGISGVSDGKGNYGTDDEKNHRFKVETISHAVTLYNRIIMESLLNGYT